MEQNEKAVEVLDAVLELAYDIEEVEFELTARKGGLKIHVEVHIEEDK